MTSGQIFTPKKYRGGWICLTIGGVLLAVAVYLATIAATRPVSIELFWTIIGVLTSAVLATIFLYRAIALFLLRFRLTRNGLKIRWGATTLRIPIAAIRAITPAPAMPVCTVLGITLPRWWLCRREGMWLFATGAASESLVVKTAATEIYISPQNAEAFIRVWQKRVPLGTTQAWSFAIERRGVWAYPLWFDRVARYLGLGALLLTLIMVGATFTRYSHLPPAIHLLSGAASASSAIVSREQLLWIPYGGIAILLLNGVLGILWHKKEPLATYLLWSLTIVVEIGLWAGFRMAVG